MHVNVMHIRSVRVIMLEAFMRMFMTMFFEYRRIMHMGMMPVIMPVAVFMDHPFMDMEMGMSSRRRKIRSEHHDPCR